jgi:GAF domain-containing protein
VESLEEDLRAQGAKLTGSGPIADSYIGVPMIVGQEIVGVIGLSSYREIRQYAEEDQHQLEMLAGTIGVAVQNAQQFEAAQLQAEQEALINRIVTKVNTLDTKAGLQFTADELGKILQVPSVVIGLMDDTRTMLEMAAAHHPAALPSPVGDILPVTGDPIMEQAVQTRRTVVIEDVAKANLPPHAREAVLKTGTRAMYVIPLMSGRDLIGTVSLNTMEVDNLITPDQLELAESIVYQVATTVHNSRLYSQSEERQARLQTAASIAKLGYWDHNGEKDLFTFDDHFYTMLHTTAEEQGGYQMSPAEYIDRFLHPDDVPLIVEAFDKAVSSTEQEYNAPLEYRVRYADGGIGHVLVRIRVLRDDEGRIILHAGTSQDITQRKLAEEVLRQSEAQLVEAAGIARLGH